MTTENKMNLNGLSDPALAWFDGEARKFNALTRGPDLQWCSNQDGTFEVRTTTALTPGRLESCQDVLQHDVNAEQSFWFCPKVCDLTTYTFNLGEEQLQGAAKLCRDAVYNDGPMNRSAVFFRRWANLSVLVISSGRETYLVKVPSRFVHEFIKITLRKEANVTYLSHLRNNV